VLVILLLQDGDFSGDFVRDGFQLFLHTDDPGLVMHGENLSGRSLGCITWACIRL